MNPFTQGVIAHRGASSLAPENTLSAFNKASILGIDWVEFDVMLSRDEIPVVFHDDTLNRITGVGHFVDELLFAELKELDAGSWFSDEFKNEKIPSLSETIHLLCRLGLKANVEIKEPHNNAKLNSIKTIEAIRQIKAPDDGMFLYSSFSIEALEQIRAMLPNAALGFLMHEWRDDCISICEKLGCVSLNLNEEIVTEERAALIKQSNLFLLAYTVDNPERARELREWGVDAVFSNAPEKTRQAVLTGNYQRDFPRYCR